MTALLELNPKKRLTAKQVLEHPWVCGGASTKQLDASLKSLKKYNASRKLRKVGNAIMAQQRMARALEGLRISSAAGASK